ncbi:MAG: hypothetical protein HW387_34 [Parachlamydiales bacterium]|nr:hypothetical protein [Parachlamydiales bacterium]
MKDRVQLLIDILFDLTAREDEREDAIMYLGESKDLRALTALLKIASDPNNDDLLVGDCAESIGELCVSMSCFEAESFKQMVPFAQKTVFRIIMARNPNLIKQPLRDELAKKFGEV